MDFDQLFPGRFIKAGEFRGKDVTLTIKDVRVEELPDDKRGTKVKGIVTFVETPKEWVLNRTNAECLKHMWGRETTAWHGKRVTLYPAQVKNNLTGQVEPAIRVRGSPDLERDTRFDLCLPRKKPIPTTLHATGKKGPNQ